MLCTSSSFELTETNCSKESMKIPKKTDTVSPVRLPRIKIEAETSVSLPIVRVEAKKLKTMKNSAQKLLKFKQAIKVTDLTESLSKDLPTMFKTIVVSPKRTSKIFASLDNNGSPEPFKLLKKSTKNYGINDISQKHKNATMEKILKEIDFSSEFSRDRKKHNAMSVIRPISP
jgi:hypothetical protein